MIAASPSNGGRGDDNCRKTRRGRVRVHSHAGFASLDRRNPHLAATGTPCHPSKRGGLPMPPKRGDVEAAADKWGVD